MDTKGTRGWGSASWFEPGDRTRVRFSQPNRWGRACASWLDPLVPSVVLLATDFSAVSDYALNVAIANARRGHSVLHIAHVLLPEEGATGLADAQRRVHALRDALTHRFGDALTVKTHVGVGPHVATIVQLAHTLDADILVVGTHGTQRRALLGSVAESLVRTAPCTVVVARPKGGA